MDIDDFRKRYLAGESISDLCKRYGMSKSAIKGRVHFEGLHRTRIDSANIMPNDLLARYMGGMSVKCLAFFYNTNRKSIVLRLNKLGIIQRNRSESMFLRMSQTSKEGRQALSSSAHAAIKNLPIEIRHANRIKVAIAKQKSIFEIGMGEPEMFSWLVARGLNPIKQLAVDVYNIDIAIGSVAIEIHNCPTNPHTCPKYMRRIEFLLKSGWSVLYIKISKRFPITSICADYAISFFQEMQRSKSTICEYRVIRGSGEVLAIGKLNGNNLSIE